MGYVISYAESMFNATGVLAGADRPDGGGHRDRRRPQAIGRTVFLLETDPVVTRGTREEPMTTHSGRIAGVIVLVAALLAAGWSSARAAEKVTVGIGGVALMVYLPTVLAKDKGFFAEEGLDVEILDIKGGGSQAASALISGSVDFSANAIDHAIKAKTQGKDLIAVHSHVRLPVMGLVVANKYKGVIKSLADLGGHPVGVTSPGSQTHMVLGYLLVKAGVKPSDVQIMGAGGSCHAAGPREGLGARGDDGRSVLHRVHQAGEGLHARRHVHQQGDPGRDGRRSAGDDAAHASGRHRQAPGDGAEDGERARQGQQAHHELVRRRAGATAPEGDQRRSKLYAESFEHAREAFPRLTRQP